MSSKRFDAFHGLWTVVRRHFWRLLARHPITNPTPSTELNLGDRMRSDMFRVITS